MSVPLTKLPLPFTDQRTYRHRMLAVLVYIEDQIYRWESDNTKLTLEALAAHACLSPFHFHRVFTGMVGESVKAYIRRLRLEQAATMLVFTERPILDVALESGYESQEAFSRAFKTRFGESPARYRKHGYRFLPPSLSRQEFFMPNEFSPEALGLEIAIKHFPATRVAAVRHVGPYAQCDSAWGTLCNWAGPKGLFDPNTQMLGICHDDPAVTDPDKIRYDACVTVPDSASIEAPAYEIILRAADYVTAIHKGPYDNLHKSYAAICGQWMPSCGREMAMEPSIEVYLNDPQTTPPDQLLTEIRIPLID